MVDQINRFYKTQRKLMQQHGKDPDIKEIAKEMEISVDEAENLMRISQQPQRSFPWLLMQLASFSMSPVSPNVTPLDAMASSQSASIISAAGPMQFGTSFAHLGCTCTKWPFQD